MTLTLATADLREEDFKTFDELEQIVAELKQPMRDEHHAVLGEVIISEWQQKQLRLERYMHGTPIHIVKGQEISRVCEVPVFVSEFEGGCPNCGGELC